MSEPAVARQRFDVFRIIKRKSGEGSLDALETLQKEQYLKELKESINNAYMEWQNSLANFESAEGKEMVDYYSYRIKASQIRYDYLLKKAKEAMNSNNKGQNPFNRIVIH